ncbi:hypothetical protein CAY60_021290 [Shouchella clausii]|uniref:hypothetical protein n=1 Tax=Bacteria TaxID=2 RepID=UPI0004E6BAF5|nr:MULTISPECIES: hypothetical protein [Bacteria]ALA55227.1 hypothetical protein DB29_0P0015 [Shouchella clausii]MBU3266280.1 hypothetical protein [Shouchella clausii]MBU3509373.1 hypothetical protein [Shouchella clausii]MDP0461988.1 hypothetical protein [Shouchella rhizosphaerae]MDP5267783.1 hypothetical protein [Shouchella clausii]
MTVEEWKEFTEKYIMTKSEVREFIGNVSGDSIWPESSFRQALESGRIKPIYNFDKGKGPGTIRLFYRPEIEKYKKNMRRN